MKIVVAKKAGHCFGVKAAIQKAFATAQAARVPVYTLGPIIHNPQVVAELESAGVRSVKNLSDVATGVIIIRSHGVPPSVLEEATRRGLSVVDATCPFVKRAQTLAQELVKEGYALVVLGDAVHPEVEGIVGTVGGSAQVVSNAAEAGALPERRRLGLIAQTTQSLENLQQVASALLTRTHTLKIYNTICNATTDLQHETRELAKRVDFMLVVGGRNSANTSRLAVICETVGVATRHIETSGEIEAGWLENVGTVGVTAGTSTPDAVIEDIVQRLRALGGEL
jgi:(E)-4-hydroxy-3-methyl-but-2-enyl pyrophosphate reductase